MTRLFGFAVLLLASRFASAAEQGALHAMAALALGSVNDAGYGATGMFAGGWQLDEVFGLEIQGGIGITEEVGVGPEQFFHVETLVPATMTVCSYDSWICPNSTIEFVVLSGIGISHFVGRWAPNVVAGFSLDSFRSVSPVEVGVRAGVLGYFDVTDIERLVAMLHLHLGIAIRFGGALRTK